MDIVLNIIQGLAGLAFLGAGGMKLMQTKDQLAANNMGWVEDFAANQVKMIGGAEVAGGLALVLSLFLSGNSTALLLGGIAGVALAVLMAGAVYTHIRRSEMSMVAPGAILGILSLVVAWNLLI